VQVKGRLVIAIDGKAVRGARDKDGKAPHLVAALVLADTCAVPYDRALALLATAELRAAEDLGDVANALLSDARAILVPLEARHS